MKKIIVLSALLALSLFLYNCGGGSGSSDSPKGENPGDPSAVHLLPSHFIAQTNSSITLHAKVLDGNGDPVGNVPVSFTNLSPIGILSALSAKTNDLGLATVTLKSTTTGFSTVQAEVNKGVAQVRDRKTVYFSSQSLTLLPYMILDVDGSDNEGPNKDEKFNEDEDFNLFENANDNQVIIRATVYDRYGNPAPFIGVSFGADSSEATFPLGNTRTADANGQAFVLVEVKPAAIRNIETVLNVTAEADNEAVGMVSLFLQPIIVSNVSVSASPTVVAPNGTSKITAGVLLNTGGAAPNGTVVSFVSTCGSVTPFAQTANGVATSDFIAPSTAGMCSITASVGGKSDSTSVRVTTALAVLPATQTLINPAINDKATYLISGGVSPYSASSNNPDLVKVEVSGSALQVTVTAVPSADTNVTITVIDSVGTSKTATLTLDVPEPAP